MKILFLHNYYRNRGGEDLSFESEVKLLRANGHDVVEHIVHNDSINDRGLGNKLQAARDTIWNVSQNSQVERLIATSQPDVMHCNNLFPQLSVSVYAAARAAKVPIVQALRNYRAMCVNSFFYRDEKVCTKCLGKPFAAAGIRHKCYRDSRIASSVVALAQLTNRKLAKRGWAPDIYFTPSAFARQVYIDSGLDPARILVKPNFIDPDPGAGLGSGGYAVFVGRLSAEKGLDTLIEAWRTRAGLGKLKIVGDGPLRESAESMAKDNPDIEFLGHQSHAEILRLLGDAAVLIMPSRWFETFGRTIAEAYSRGVPVIASRLGAMQELVEEGRTGFLFESGDPIDLAEKVHRFQSLDQSQQQSFRERARQCYLDKYTQAANHRDLMRIYGVALGGVPTSTPTKEKASVLVAESMGYESEA